MDIRKLRELGELDALAGSHSQRSTTFRTLSTVRLPESNMNGVIGEPLWN